MEHPLARLDDLGCRIPLGFGSSKGAVVDSLSLFLLTLFSQHFRLPVPHPSPPLVLHKRIFRFSLLRTLFTASATGPVGNARRFRANSCSH
jgi:hypothetical protein